jgi:antirestriction protein ArdC
MIPRNALTDQEYSGGNIDLLLEAMEERGYTDSRFLTFKQALEMGRVVRKGEKAAAFISKVVAKKRTDKDGAEKESKTVKHYAVFNFSQTQELEGVAVSTT